jgi:hypothetical protein
MANEVSNDNRLKFVLNAVVAEELVNDKGEIQLNQTEGKTIVFDESILDFSIPLVENEKELEDIE